MWPEDPNSPGAPPSLVLTEEEKEARHAACVCGKLPFYLGVDVACALHTTKDFDRLVSLRRQVRAGVERWAGDTAPAEDQRFVVMAEPLVGDYRETNGYPEWYNGDDWVRGEGNNSD